MAKLTFTSKISAQLPLLRLRNVLPVEVPLATRLQKLERTGLPILTSPLAFSQTLLQIEKELGTCHATLIGLLSASGLENIVETQRAVTQFEDIFSQIRRDVPDAAHSIQRLFEFLRPKVIFVEPWDSVEAEQGIGTDMPRALNGLEANLKGENKEIGNCTVCSSLFALLQLRSGNIAGEARKINSMHSFAYAALDNGGYKAEYLYDRIARKKFTLEEIQKRYGRNDEAWRPFFQEVKQLAVNPKRQKLQSGDRQEVTWQEMEISPKAAFCFKSNTDPQVIINSFPGNRERTAITHFRDKDLRQSHLFGYDRSNRSLLLSSAFTFIASLLSIKIDDVFAFQMFEEMNVSQRSSLLDRLLVIGMINPFSYQLEDQLLDISKGLSDYPSWVNTPLVSPDGLRQIFPSLMVRI